MASGHQPARGRGATSTGQWCRQVRTGESATGWFARKRAGRTFWFVEWAMLNDPSLRLMVTVKSSSSDSFSLLSSFRFMTVVFIMIFVRWILCVYYMYIIYCFFARFQLWTYPWLLLSHLDFFQQYSNRCLSYNIGRLLEGVTFGDPFFTLNLKVHHYMVVSEESMSSWLTFPGFEMNITLQMRCTRVSSLSSYDRCNYLVLLVIQRWSDVALIIGGIVVEGEAPVTGVLSVVPLTFGLTLLSPLESRLLSKVSLLVASPSEYVCAWCVSTGVCEWCSPLSLEFELTPSLIMSVTHLRVWHDALSWDGKAVLLSLSYDWKKGSWESSSKDMSSIPDYERSSKAPKSKHD